MGLGCGLQCCRLLLFAFNFLFWLLGVTLLGIGVWSRIEGDEAWDSLIKGNPQLTAANMMIASGVFVTIIGFLGCCGAIKKNRCMLISYAILILVIFALEVGAGVYAYTKRDKIQGALEEGFREAVKKSYGRKETVDHKLTSADEALTKGVDWFQITMKCCGSAAPSDWKASEWYRKHTGRDRRVVPQSCCINPSKKDCNKGTLKDLTNPRDTKIFNEGCVPKVKEFLTSTVSHMAKIFGVAIGIAVVQLLGIVIACCLSSAVKEEGGG